MTFRSLSVASAAFWAGACTLVVLGADGPQAPPGTHPLSPAATPDPTLFAASGDCVACHNDLVSPAGEDVSIGVSWRGSIMGNAARDPYFHAGVRRETIDHPSARAAIEDECAACHMPAARAAARAAGANGAIFAHLSAAAAGETTALDDIAIDGVSCTVCHQIAPDGLGTRERFNGNFALGKAQPSRARPAFGPFAPDAGRRRIMHSVTGFEQVQGDHIRQSELCATCHTLITEALGPDGRVIGSLPEQMNYQEWRHSAFSGEGRSCQSCHMPAVDGPIRVSSVLGNDRDRLARHTFLGGNAFMLRLMNRFRTELGIVATPAELETTARATVRQLERDTATVAVDRAEFTGGVLALDVVVTNLTGHKLPTGYPSRRVWLHVTARDAGGRVRLRIRACARRTGPSTATPAMLTARRSSRTTPRSPRADEVQIYESIMGTPAGTPDDRLAPGDPIPQGQPARAARVRQGEARPLRSRWSAPPRATTTSVAAAIASGTASRSVPPRLSRSTSNFAISRLHIDGRRTSRPTMRPSQSASSATSTAWRLNRRRSWRRQRGWSGREGEGRHIG